MYKTIGEWEEEYGFKILDLDGFDRNDPKLAEREFTKEEWDDSWPKCTIERVGADGTVYSGTPLYAAPEQSPPNGWANAYGADVEK